MFLFLETTTASAWSTMLSSTLPFILVLAVMYFMLIMPQKKRDKRMEEMRSGIEIGDGVVTTGGVVGRVISLKEDTIVVESASSRIRFKRTSVIEVEKLNMD